MICPVTVVHRAMRLYAIVNNVPEFRVRGSRRPEPEAQNGRSADRRTCVGTGKNNRFGARCNNGACAPASDWRDNACRALITRPHRLTPRIDALCSAVFAETTLAFPWYSSATVHFNHCSPFGLSSLVTRHSSVFQ